MRQNNSHTIFLHVFFEYTIVAVIVYYFRDHSTLYIDFAPLTHNWAFNDPVR